MKAHHDVPSDEALNDITYEEALNELGEKGLLDIAEITRWLQTGLPWQAGESMGKMLELLRCKWSARVAPSIVARGLADFLGVSYPRFALRIYLPPPSGAVQGSFINAIRIGSLCSEVRAWGQRNLELPEDRRLKDFEVRPEAKGPEAFFRQGTCIGDCVIELPPRLPRGYQTIAREFGRAYGEGRSLIGIPFVRSMALSGLCAQAVCFMATASLHRESTGVHGISEITRYADGSDRLELKVSGLSLRGMQTYFANVNLGARTISFSGLGTVDGLLQGGSLRAAYLAAVKGCLRSGFPVIFPMDLGRMAGIRSPYFANDPLGTQPSILTRNRLSQDRVPGGRKPRSRRHAILAVGFAGDDVLLNDPTFLPLMEASFDQLFLARPYAASKSKAGKPMSKLADFSVLPVLPLAVKLPLAQRIDDRAPGLLNLAYAVHQRLARQSGRSVFSFHPGELLLARPCSDGERIIAFGNEFFGTDFWPRRLVEEWKTKLGDRWIWFQAVGHEIWLWDAQFNPDRATQVEDQAREALLVRLAWTGHDIEVASMVERGFDGLRVEPKTESMQRHPREEEQLPHPAGLRHGMISSFAARGLGSWRRPWPGGHCNLYCFIQADGENFLRSPARPQPEEFAAFEQAKARNAWRRRWFAPKIYGVNPAHWKWRQPTLGNVSPRCNVLRLLAALPDDPKKAGDHTRRVAQEILGQLGEHGEVPEIAALSSYLPEISDACPKKRADAVAALRYLMRLGAQLNPERCARGQFTLEIVAGGLTNGIWPAEPQAEAEFVINLRTFEETLDAFHQSLQQLAPTWRETGVRISVECEPGPLYLLGTWAYLGKFCDLLSEGSPLREFVGLNMDIAHWAFLKKLRPDSIPEKISSLIQSVHLSDHGDAGHFGDSMPFEVHRRERFIEWLNFLERLSPPKFTGLVSGEFEAAAAGWQVKEFAWRMGMPVGARRRNTRRLDR